MSERVEWPDEAREAVRQGIYRLRYGTHDWQTHDGHRYDGACPVCRPDREELHPQVVEAALAALAPHVEVMLDRARAEGAEKALREAADWIRSATEGVDQAGTATWPAHDRAIYALAIEEVEDALTERADEIGGAS